MNRAIFESHVPEDFCDKNICVLGLGFVGVTLATTMAEVGFNVTGIEIRNDLFKMLSSAKPYFFEPGLSAQLKRVIERGSLKIYQKIPENCKSTVFIITVGTPLDENKEINLSSIQNICFDISGHLKDGDLVILRSTVKLGTTRSVVIPTLDMTGKEFEVAFCPERTVEGQAMSELRYLPQVIGSNKRVTSIRASHIFQFLTPTVLLVKDLETAEMIKLIDNTKRDVFFGFSNEVARLCDAAGLSAEEVIRIGRFGYSRTDLPTPGPVGGPCLSKDSHILAQSMQEFGVTPSIAIAARKINEEQPEEVIRFLGEYINSCKFPKKMTISLMGIAFKGKPATDDLRGTTAKPIFEALKREFPNAEFFGYDPVVNPKAIREFGLIPIPEPQQAFEQVNLTLILNNHPFFSTMPIEKWAAEMAKPGIIYDFWNNFSEKNLCLPESIRYVTLGSHHYIRSKQSVKQNNSVRREELFV